MLLRYKSSLPSFLRRQESSTNLNFKINPPQSPFLKGEAFPLIKNFAGFKKSPIIQIMKVKIHRIDQSLALPKYETNGSFAFDFITRETTVIPAKKRVLVPGNVIIECPENCYCYCDYNHICNALGSILNNAQRYTNTQISLSSYQDHGFIVFCIEDDGTGYPDQLLSIDLNNIPSNWISGSTGLGLHFVSTIATLHTARNTTGYIKIDNNSALGGARFRLFLP